MSAGSELRKKLTTLSAPDRAELAVFLIDSLDADVDENADELWQVELERRAEQIKAGSAKGEPAGSVMDRLWKKHS
jgi:putative addiction module component (TIGR02574 family)